jgi:hypothetical protein
MSKEQLLGVVRHALTFIGGILVVKGYADDAMIQELLGGALTLAGGAWSIMHKKTEKV